MSCSRPLIALNMIALERNGNEYSACITRYAERIWAAGGMPVWVPVMDDPAMMDEYLAHVHGAVLIGGPDYRPESYGESPAQETDLTRLHPDFDIVFGRKVLASGLPVLGICAGCQLLAIVSGGKLIQHLPNADSAHRNGLLHTARIGRDGHLARALGLHAGADFTVNSFHHQAVNAESLSRFAVTARAFDGTVEAIEAKDTACMALGVQFHPERMDDLGPKLFSYLIEQSRFTAK